jgi:molybdenum cofactor cytidylyltransferase
MTALSSTCVALLAAGSSHRYSHGNKLLATLGDRPLIDYAAQTLSALPSQCAIAICRPRDEDVHHILRQRGFEIVMNPDAALGQSHSLRLAAAAARTMGAEALLVALGDMPFVPDRHFKEVVSIVDPKNNRPVIASQCRDTGVRQPPACFDVSLFSTLENLREDQGARSLIQNCGAVEAPASDLRDFDTEQHFLSMMG